MPEYLRPPLTTDPDALAQDAYAVLEASIPGYVANPANLDAVIIEAVAQAAATQNDIASATTTAIFRSFGGLLGVFPLDAIPATGTATITVVDTAGYTVPAAFPVTVGLRDANGDLQAFDLQADVTIAPGGSTGAGTFVAETAGVDMNGLSGTAVLITAPGFVTGVTFTAATAQGEDAEDDGVYLNRLTQTLALMTPRAIIADDFAVLSRSIAGVYRAAAVDGLKPGPPYDGAAEATSQPATITVAVVDAAGQPVGSTIRGQVDALLQSLREQSFNVFVVDPQYTEIDVTTTVQAWPGYDTATVRAAIVSALEAYLSPIAWGTDVSGDPTTWVNDPTLRVGELFSVVASVSGVRYVSSLTFGLHGGSLAATDVTLGAGSAIPALPTTAGADLTVTVTPG